MKLIKEKSIAQMQRARDSEQQQANERKRKIEYDKQVGHKKREQFFDNKNKAARHDIEEQGSYLTQQIS